MSDVTMELAKEALDKTMEIARLRAENDGLRKDAAETALMLGAAWEHCSKLRELVRDMHAALQAFCDAQDVHGDNCPLWVERTDDCELRGIERRMRELGVD